MMYNDGLPTDKYGFLLACPKCGNKEFSGRAHQCAVCGEERQNFCMPEDKKRPRHVNASNARFCETCGAETLLYHYRRLLPWQDAQDRLRSGSGPAFSEPSVELPF